MIPVIDVLELVYSCSLEKIKKPNPDIVMIIPSQTSNEGFSPKKIIPKTPVKISGPANRIKDNTNGDSLLSEAKNKLSPIAIPNNPLRNIFKRNSMSILKLVFVRNIRIARKNMLKLAFIKVIAIGSNLSPNFLKARVHIAQQPVDINASIIPIISLFIL